MQAVPDDPSVIALLYGPFVLAGNPGKDGSGRENRYGSNAPLLNRVLSVVVPVFRYGQDCGCASEAVCRRTFVLVAATEIDARLKEREGYIPNP